MRRLIIDQSVGCLLSSISRSWLYIIKWVSQAYVDCLGSGLVQIWSQLGQFWLRYKRIYRGIWWVVNRKVSEQPGQYLKVGLRRSTSHICVMNLCILGIIQTRNDGVIVKVWCAYSTWYKTPSILTMRYGIQKQKERDYSACIFLQLVLILYYLSHIWCDYRGR